MSRISSAPVYGPHTDLWLPRNEDFAATGGRPLGWTFLGGLFLVVALASCDSITVDGVGTGDGGEQSEGEGEDELTGEGEGEGPGEGEGEGEGDPDPEPSNTPPTAPVITLFPLSPITSDELSVSVVVDGDDADGDALTYSYRWLRNGNVVGDLTGPTVPADRTSKGDTWTVVVLADDGLDQSAPAQASVTIANARPSATLAFVQTTPTRAGPLETLVTLQDIDGDVVTATWVWTADGVVLPQIGSTLPGSVLRRGQTITVRVTPNDGDDDGEAVSLDTTVGNAPPEGAAVTVTPTQGLTTQTALVASANGIFDVDGDNIILRWQWSIDGMPVPGVSGPSLPAFSARKGQSVTVAVTPNDGFGDGATLVSSAVVVEDAAPSLQSASIVPIVVREANVVSCALTGFADLDNDLDASLVRFFVNDVIVSSGPPTMTLTGQNFARGDRLRCEGEPRSGQPTLSGLVVSSTEVVVQNTPPRASSVVIQPSSPTRSATLTAALDGVIDDDGDAISVSYSWRVQGQERASGQSVQGSVFARGESIVVVATPSDGRQTGDTVASLPVVMQNTPPTVAAARIQLAVGQSEASRGAPLTAVAESAADPDGDAVTVRFVWRRGATVLAEGASLDPSLFVRGDVITLHATPNDGVVDGATVTSNPVTIADVAPRVTGATLAPDTLRELSTVTCESVGFLDLDGDLDASFARFFVNGTEVLAGPASNTTLLGTRFRKGDRIQCELTARTSDPDVDGNVVVSAVRTVENTPPVLTSATPNLETARKGDIVDVVTMGAADDDGDELTFEVAWFVGNTERVRGSPVSANLFAKGESVVAVVRAFDGAAMSDAVTTTPVEIVNTPPTLTGARIVLPVGETVATKATLLSAAADGPSDVDGDAVTTSFSWRTGSVVVGTGASLPPTAFSRGDVVTLTAVPFDGEESGNQVTSTSLTIGNARPSAPSITVTPAQPTDTDTLRCVVTTGSTDLDNDAVRYAIAWTKNGAATAFSATNQVVGGEVTVPDSATAVGETWTCTVTADDQNGGTRTATSARTIASPNCTAASFSGASFGSVPDSPMLSLGSSDFTVEFFVRKTNNNPGDNFIGHDEGPGNTNKWIVTVGQPPGASELMLHFHLNSPQGGAGWLAQRRAVLLPNGWNHVAVARRDSVLMVFINGRLSASETFTGSIPDPSAPLTLAQAEGGGFVNGAFSEVRLSRVARYVDDFVPTPRFVSDSDTIALYHLDETSGATALDSGPNGLHMTLTPGATRTTNASMCTQREAYTTASFLVANTNLPGDARPSSIERVDVHSGSVAAMVTLVSPANALIDQPRGLDIDVRSRQMFIREATGKVRRANWDGTGYETIATADIHGVGLHVDGGAGRVVWSQEGAVRDALLDGSNARTLVTEGYPVGVFVDDEGDRLFWHDLNSASIRRATREGQNPQSVVSGVFQCSGFDLDRTTDSLWFTDAAGTIKKVNANAVNGAATIVLAGRTSPTDLVVDVENGFVYWTESSGGGRGLYRSRLDGTAVTTLSTDLGTPFGMARLPDVGEAP
jgi:hypothetical protein